LTLPSAETASLCGWFTGLNSPLHSGGFGGTTVHPDIMHNINNAALKRMLFSLYSAF